ncbi:MAG: NADH:ubiquinone reductase (Na(+)-transporting) subunit A, partial [Chlamydiia bacterium]|nr:NADH:ubiquinone reductase (Na(+)-transporting) subunit A [Chlamydiia bacterium]
MDIQIKRGLKIPLAGAPKMELNQFSFPRLAALDVSTHETLRFQCLIKPGDKIACGAPVLEDKSTPGRYFVAPVSGTIKEIVRGEKRRILFVSIEADSEQSMRPIAPMQSLDQEQIAQRLLECGLFASIYQRPCKRLASPHVKPEAIFVKALESAPFLPSPEIEIQERKTDFANGLEALKKFAKVHVVSAAKLQCPEGVENHTATGPHPCSNPSLHIYHIHPVKRPDQVVWTLSAHTVIAIGCALRGEFYQSKIIAFAGEGVKESERALYRVQEGSSVRELLEHRLVEGSMRLISGDPLMGHLTDFDRFLTQDAFALCAIPELVKRSFLHFLGFGCSRYTATRAYLSAFLNHKERSFSTSQHGEQRAFVDGSYYDRVMPMRIPTMPLIKALLAEDFE